MELLKSLNEAIDEEDMQWALQLSDRLIALEFSLDETKALRKKALIILVSVHQTLIKGTIF